MNRPLHCIWLVAILSMMGCHWRGEKPPQAESESKPATEQGSTNRRVYSQRFTVYEHSITQKLDELKIPFTIEENPRLQVGLAKFLLAKIIKSDSGLTIVIGTPTEWEGFVPQSGIEYQTNGKPSGIHVNNLGRSEQSEKSIHCYFTYGNTPDVERRSIIATIRRIEQDH